MSTNDRVIRTAMDVVLTWGPERMVSEEDRLLIQHPELSPEQVQEALAEAHRVMRESESLAPGIKRGLLNSGHKELRRRWPWLTKDQAERVINQGLYYHWRDTGE